MPPRKPGTPNLEASETKIGEAIPKAVIDTAHDIVGISPQIDPAEEIAAVRGQLDALRERVSETAAKVGGGAYQAARRAEATAKLYPVSSVLAVAGLAALFVLIATGIRSAPPRSRSQRLLDELQDLYGKARRRF